MESSYAWIHGSVRPIVERDNIIISIIKVVASEVFPEVALSSPTYLVGGIGSDPPFGFGGEAKKSRRSSSLLAALTIQPNNPLHPVKLGGSSVAFSSPGHW